MASWFIYNFFQIIFIFHEKMSKYAEILILKSDFSNVPPVCHIRDKRWKKPSSASDRFQAANEQEKRRQWSNLSLMWYFIVTQELFHWLQGQKEKKNQLP